MATNESSNPALERAFDHLRLTGRHLFLTGKAEAAVAAASSPDAPNASEVRA